jgi:hypothetical protein
LNFSILSVASTWYIVPCYPLFHLVFEFTTLEKHWSNNTKAIKKNPFSCRGWFSQKLFYSFPSKDLVLKVKAKYDRWNYISSSKCTSDGIKGYKYTTHIMCCGLCLETCGAAKYSSGTALLVCIYIFNGDFCPFRVELQNTQKKKVTLIVM